ncbi:DNA cytosine methyltransferase [Streptomyces sp. NBC_00669]|uniref:DNA cytosine methyltransferase n=1 Tax=Streptomyces sp. NBC_00669 TaxID=2976011 RepID=UPI002E351905|nr:DNA cytosine methyltransferase [Streptomyces sp. NBC_00669]
MDLFAGPGGLDVAAQCLGIPVTGIEWDTDACATRRAFEGDLKPEDPHLRTVQGDVRDFGPEAFPEANILTGGPPCQSFTVAGTGAGRRALDEVLGFIDAMAQGKDVRSDAALIDGDKRTGLVLEPLRWALTALDQGRPYEAIVLEQVPAVLPVWKRMAEILRTRGYSVAEPRVLHTEEYGVPQTRRRAILVARYRVPGDPIVAARLPEPTHQRYRKGGAATQTSLATWVSMGQALDRSNFTVISNYGTGGDPKARGRRTDKDPAFTVTGKIFRNRVVSVTNGVVHEGRFTSEEAGLLQTFPRFYPWKGNAIAQQIGNAIPPLLAAHILTAALDLPLPAQGRVALGYDGF